MMNLFMKQEPLFDGDRQSVKKETSSYIASQPTPYGTAGSVRSDP
jgi:hypothetical protein